MADRTPLTLRLEDELLDEIGARARKEGVTRHALIVSLLRTGLDARAQLRKELRAALAGLL
jgi:metal-responsive CopG/Arc/MetJ family transcriptional regulator